MLIPFNCYWIAVMEVQWDSVAATCVSLFFNVIFLLFVMGLANMLLQRKAPRFALSPAEMLVVYIMLSIASAIAGRDTMTNLFPTLGHPMQFANEVNRYDRFFRFIPDWLAPKSEILLKSYYQGQASIYDWEILRGWLPIIGAWSVFILAILTAMLCINVIVRKHWMDQEKLTFPTVFLPLAMAKDRTFYRSPMLWIGFGITFAVELMNGLHYLFPAVPYLNLKLQDVGRYFTTAPWNGLGWLPIAFYPFAIGMAFLLPLDLSFSCWFFYVVKKLEAVAAVAWGYTNPGGITWPYLREQGSGAWIGLCIFLLWSGRKHIAGVFKSAFSSKGYVDSPQAIPEIISYKASVIGLAIAAAVVFVFCVSAGMSFWLPPLYFAIFFLLVIGITRIRAELGPPAHELNWINPENIVVSLLGTSVLGTQNLTILSYMFWFNRGYRSLPMPHQLEAMKIGRESGMEPKRLLAAIVLSSVIGVLATFWVYLHLFNRLGEATANIQSYTTGIGIEAFSRLNEWTMAPRGPNTVQLAWMGFGFGFTFFLMTMKSIFFWWPFHPAGYALANSYALEYWWTTIFIGWLTKLLIVRYGGMKGFRKALPFFLGLILGDYIAASMWSIVGWVLGTSVYRVFIF